MQLKTFIITVSKTFPRYHPKAGQLTHFREKILEGEKIHTGRMNYNFWKNRIDQINAGKGILSLRNWSGKPYASKQEEFLQLSKVGLQSFELTDLGMIFIDNRIIRIDDHGQFAKNDGLDQQDLYDWFQLGKKSIRDGALIQFTDFKY
jgi:hypothetical protein